MFWWFWRLANDPCPGAVIRCQYPHWHGVTLYFYQEKNRPMTSNIIILGTTKILWLIKKARLKKVSGTFQLFFFYVFQWKRILLKGSERVRCICTDHVRLSVCQSVAPVFVNKVIDFWLDASYIIRNGFETHIFH